MSIDRPRDASAEAMLSNDLADLMVPGVVVEVDASEAESLGAFHQGFRHGQAESDGLARSGLGRHQQVAAFRVRLDHRLLDRRGGVVIALNKRAGQSGMDGREGQGGNFQGRIFGPSLVLSPKKDRESRGRPFISPMRRPFWRATGGLYCPASAG